MMNRRNLLAAAAVALLAGPAFAAGDSAKAIEINARADAALTQLYAESGAAVELSKKAVGILILPRIVKAGLVIGGETGDGVMRVGGANVAYYNMSSVTLGFQAGAQSYSQVLMFLKKKELDKFLAGNGWEAGVDGSVAVLDSGVSGGVDTASIKDPIVAFVFGEKGLMASANVEGSKYTKIDP